MRAEAAFHTSPTGRPNRTADIAKVGDAIKHPLLPWVVRAFDVTTEYNPDGSPVHPQALWTVPRQSGKTVGVSTYSIEKAMRHPDQYGVYVAQSREAARKRLRSMASYVTRSRIDPGCKFLKGVGNERLEFTNGSLIEVASPTDSAIHGDSLDFAILDEVFAIDPTVLYDGILPAMLARPEAQVLMISTAGTMASELLNELREMGRANPDGPMAFVEYSKPDGLHPYDEDSWWLWHPGLGTTTSVKKLRQAAETTPLSAFMRANCNITTNVTDPVWPDAWWARSAANVSPVDGLALAVDRSALGCSITAAFQTAEGWHGDLIEYREGDGFEWVETRLGELMARFDPSVVAVDALGPVGALLPVLQDLTERARIPLRTFTRADRAKADGFLFEQLRAEAFTHSHSAVLAEASGATPAKTTGDVWLFDRNAAMMDPSPIIALSMALYAGYEVEVLDPKPAIFVG